MYMYIPLCTTIKCLKGEKEREEGIRLRDRGKGGDQRERKGGKGGGGTRKEEDTGSTNVTVTGGKAVDLTVQGTQFNKN